MEVARLGRRVREGAIAIYGRRRRNKMSAGRYVDDMHRLSLLASLLVLAVIGGCGDDPSMGGLEMGEAVYREALADGNTFACATCHALSEPAADGFTRPGHPIGDATRRATYKDGSIVDMRTAVNTCVTEWMNGEPWTESDPRWTSLFAFLEAQATVDTAPDVDIQIVPPPADLSGGDPTAGREMFNARCIVCHGEDAVGTERAPPLVGAPLAAAYVALRVRTSGRSDSSTYDGLTGGVMPFWGADRLSDAELIDVAAYVEARSMEMPPPDSGMGDAGIGDSGPTDTGPSGCDATHARVGQTAMLSTDFHRTTGTARVVDDCTIIVEMFGYDGTGIDVRFYGAIGRNYRGGFAISDDLLLAGGYDGATMTLTLPSGRTLDDMDSISVWCVAAGVSFGDGVFM